MLRCRKRVSRTRACPNRAEQGSWLSSPCSSGKRRLTLETPRDACGKQVRSSALSGKLPCGGTCRSTLMRKCLRSPLWISLALDYHHHLPTLPAHPLPSLSLLDHVLTKATLPLKYLIGIKAQVAKHHPVSIACSSALGARCGLNAAHLSGTSSSSPRCLVWMHVGVR